MRHQLPSLARLALLLALCAGILPAAETLAGGRRAVSFEVNGQWIGEGVSFSPYRDGQGPDGQPLPTRAEIAADLQLVSRYWKLIRMYDSTGVTEETLRIIRDEHLPLKVIVGAWIAGEKKPADPEKNRTEAANAIRLANTYPDQVLAVSVGNEACVWWSDHRADPAVVIRHIRAVRAAIRQPVAIADDYDFWEKPESRSIAAEVDFIILHAYALWHGRPVDHAVDWLAHIYDQAVQFHAGTPIIIGETGWATQHDATRTQQGQEGDLMKGETSEAAQLDYLRQHYRWVRSRRVPTFLFEAFDENWKGDGAKSSPAAAEKHWGVFDTQRRPKSSFAAIIREFYQQPR